MTILKTTIPLLSSSLLFILVTISIQNFSYCDMEAYLHSEFIGKNPSIAIYPFGGQTQQAKLNSDQFTSAVRTYFTKIENFRVVEVQNAATVTSAQQSAIQNAIDRNLTLSHEQIARIANQTQADYLVFGSITSISAGTHFDDIAAVVSANGRIVRVKDGVVVTSTNVTEKSFHTNERGRMNMTQEQIEEALQDTARLLVQQLVYSP